MSTSTKSEPSPSLRLELRYRGADFHCQLAGNPSVWDCGRSHDEAIGRWIISHGDDFGIRVERVNDKPGTGSAGIAETDSN